MKVLTFSRTFPKGHPKYGQPTYFVEKIWKGMWDTEKSGYNPCHPYFLKYDEVFPYTGDRNENIHQHGPKYHTIRAGNHWKAGDEFSAKVWSGDPYRSKQVEFSQLEVKRTWGFNIEVVRNELHAQIPGVGSFGFTSDSNSLRIIAANDGLAVEDFISWFSIHPKKKGQEFTGQIICWNETIEYNGKPEGLDPNNLS